MSPERSAAPHTFQFFSVITAWGSSPLPKLWVSPLGNCIVSVPWRILCSSRRTLRAAAGAPWGRESEGAVRVFMAELVFR
jgi:hypothetical protein